MKNLKNHLVKTILLLTCFTIMNCQSNYTGTKYLVTTKVVIKEGEIDKVLQLFKDTNPTLVKDQSDWLNAVFSKNDVTSTVMVQAYWKDKTSYLNFSKSAEFENTMKQFGQYFKGKPKVEITEVLFEM